MKIKQNFNSMHRVLLYGFAIFAWTVLSCGCSKYSEVFSSTSPDGNSVLKISKKVVFPPSEMVDPSIIVKIEIKGYRPAVYKEKLKEDSDLILEPEVTWESESVKVSNLSSRKEISVEFKKITQPAG